MKKLLPIEKCFDCTFCTTLGCSKAELGKFKKIINQNKIQNWCPLQNENFKNIVTYFISYDYKIEFKGQFPKRKTINGRAEAIISNISPIINMNDLSKLKEGIASTYKKEYNGIVEVTLIINCISKLD